MVFHVTTTKSFEPLPVIHTTTGKPRRVGCEVEFAGLEEADAARALQSCLGGQIDEDHGHLMHLKDSAIGTLKIALDTALPKNTDNPATRAMTGLLAKVVPVEIVTEPLELEELKAFSHALETLEMKGAVGSQDGVFYGFGVHLNVEIPGLDDPHTLKTIRAFAALDPYLRETFPINLTRRILPFIKSWPDEFVRELIERRPVAMRQVMAIAADHVPSRNYALDLYPVFKNAWPRAFETFFPHDDTTKARASFHFRLPDSRLGERVWSLSEAWNMWRLVEDVAQKNRVLHTLEDAWLRARDPKMPSKPIDTIAQTKQLLEAHLA